mmetsp:Transcript_15016/g.36677  ORF Transcript_15016/g.36677 Transcript_15016/m.36677 type:complete len:508 (+) Transcript_15016:127-1650(+)
MMASSLQYGDVSQSDKSCLPCLDRNDGSKEPGLPVQQKRTVQTWDEMKQTEDYLAAELYKLSVQERAKAMDDIHCLGEELKETPEMVEKLLEEFDQIVRQVKTPFYEMAVIQNREHVEDPSFRLRFLRCNMHNVHLSVRQMMDYLKYKATYFGEDKVARGITLDDFNDEDMELVMSGLYHIQKERDRSGRAVVYVMNDVFGRCKLENLIHVAYYVWNNILIPMHNVQMKGICFVYYDMTKQGEKYAMPGLNFMRTLTKVLMSFPLRYSAIHLCLNPERGDLALTNSLFSYTMKQVSRYVGVRTRLQYGSDMEVQYALRSHGVPEKGFPVDADGNIRKDIMNEWFYRHKEEIEAKKQHRKVLATHASLHQPVEYSNLGHNAQESGLEPVVAATAGTDQIESETNRPPRKEGGINPSPQDVLLGRGWRVQNHEGNVRFRSFLEAYSDEYDTAARLRKRQIAGQLVNLLRGRGVRFLKQTDASEWIESSFEDAEKKVGQLFRTLRKQSRT